LKSTRGNSHGRENGRKLSGIVLVDKPTGITSHDVVNYARKILNISEVGHAGTLDPLATGLMLVLAGYSTKFSRFFLKLPKVYVGEILLGPLSDTLDISGRQLPSAIPDSLPYQKAGEMERPFLIPREVYGLLPGEVEKALSSFVGTLPQKPPQYSALKVKGVPSYKRIRKGEDITLPDRIVTAYALTLLEYTPPVLTFRAQVSSGYYIRSLARDLGIALGFPGGILKRLRRISLGSFLADRALSIPFTRKELECRLIAPRESLQGLPEYLATPEEEKGFFNGTPLTGEKLDVSRLYVPPFFKILALNGEKSDSDSISSGYLQESHSCPESGAAQFLSQERKESFLSGELKPLLNYFSDPLRPVGLPAGFIKVLSPSGKVVALAECGYEHPEHLLGRTDTNFSSPLEEWATLLPSRPFLRPRRVFAP
jgi:tRNA pseudouridine55 synthase